MKRVRKPDESDSSSSDSEETSEEAPKQPEVTTPETPKPEVITEPNTNASGSETESHSSSMTSKENENGKVVSASAAAPAAKRGRESDSETTNKKLKAAKKEEESDSAHPKKTSKPTKKAAAAAKGKAEKSQKAEKERVEKAEKVEKERVEKAETERVEKAETERVEKAEKAEKAEAEKEKEKPAKKSRKRQHENENAETSKDVKPTPAKAVKEKGDKSAKSETDASAQKKKAVTWTMEAEMLLAQQMLADHKAGVHASSADIRQFINGKQSVDFSTQQINDKQRRLKIKYRKQGGKAAKKSEDELFAILRQMWGTDSQLSDDEENNKDELESVEGAAPAPASAAAAPASTSVAAAAPAPAAAAPAPAAAAAAAAKKIAEVNENVGLQLVKMNDIEEQVEACMKKEKKSMMMAFECALKKFEEKASNVLEKTSEESNSNYGFIIDKLAALMSKAGDGGVGVAGGHMKFVDSLLHHATLGIEFSSSKMSDLRKKWMEEHVQDIRVMRSKVKLVDEYLQIQEDDILSKLKFLS